MRMMQGMSSMKRNAPVLFCQAAHR